ncbi:ABC transporter permease [Acrocarpospora corrugata]|uniref:ABC transporter permease n=1 Tax=Acrocarpospora corrugata TaxID=35763 RepID=A0A5M3VW19_9ACTN|nr:ABC transporter permease subunit [Acrocarpospora corrugata]GER99292.1 ABC transporter permease [Acrocarpospora corrugata]
MTTTLADTIRSEWCKAWTMRSTWITVLGIVVLGTLFALLFGFARATEYARFTIAERAAYQPDPDFRALLFAQIVVGYLGLRAFTVEYATRTMPLTLTTTPRRGRVLAAKALVCAAVTLVTGTVTGLAAFFVSRAVLIARDVPVNSLDQPGMTRVMAGAGLLLALVSLIGLAIGCLIRSTAGALSIVIVIGILVPAMSSLYPEWLARLILSYWPITAGLRLLSLDADPTLPGPWAGIAVTCGWAAVLLAAAFAAFRVRDA